MAWLWITEAFVGGGFKDDTTQPDTTGSQSRGSDAAPFTGLVPRRTVLRLGTVAAAGVGAAALIPATTADRADAASTAPPLAYTTNEAYGGVFVRPRALERWMCSNKSVRHVVCVGDSITSGEPGGFNYASGGRGSWPEQLATAAGTAIGPGVGFGYRGLWLRAASPNPEWAIAGTWTRTLSSDVFDVCPFGSGLRSSGGGSATLTWTKPAPITVAGFDLYWFNMSGAGNWQYRVDGGAWTNMGQTLSPTDNKLHKFYVAKPIRTSLQIRASNGTAPCLAPIGGIGIYAADPNTARGIVVHNLGSSGQLLAEFVRESSGNPLAWFDAVVANPVPLGFKPDLVICMFSNDVRSRHPELWKHNLIKLVNRVHPYADVLLMSPYAQTFPTQDVQAAYRSAIMTVATTHDCGLLDLYDAWAAAGATGWSEAAAAGLMLDGLHPSQRGHNDMAARVWRLLRVFS